MRDVMYALRALVWGFVVMSLPIAAAAQDVPRVEVSAGWRLLMPTQELIREFDDRFPLGWYGDVAITLTDTIAIVGDFAGSYKTIDRSYTISPAVATEVDVDLRLYSFMGGVRFSNRRNVRIVPYGQVLIGVTPGSIRGTSTTTAFGRSTTVNLSEETAGKLTFDIGAGMTLNVIDAAGIRISGSYLQPTQRPFSPRATNGGAGGVRFGVGIVLPL
jgi:hypothetical protein